MKAFLWYVFNPNPGHAMYSTPWMVALLVACVGLIVLSVLIRLWRRSLKSAVTKKLSRSWSMAALWFGIAGLIMAVCRVEGIQFMATRLLWGIWILGALFYLFVQGKLYRARHYEVLPRIKASDPRAKYLPTKRRK